MSPKDKKLIKILKDEIKNYIFLPEKIAEKALKV
ncbi:hypothetical protein N5T35_26680 [Escherichia coli]|nr:hypothetical protein [Escherichia coli]